MGLLSRALSKRTDKVEAQAPPAQPAAEAPADAAAQNAAAQAKLAVNPLRLGKLVSAAGRMLTPRGSSRRRDGEASARDSSSPAATKGEAMLIEAYRPALTALMEQKQQTQSPRVLASSTPRYRKVPATPRLPAADSSDSEADSDVSSLDGFGTLDRASPNLEAEDVAANSTADPAARAASRALKSERGSGTPRSSARDSQRGAEDLEHFLQTGELPGSRRRLARLLTHADSVGKEAFHGLPLQELGYDRCVALLLQVMLPLPLPTRSPALELLQGKLANQVMAFLGGQLERLLESERACQRFSVLPYEIAHWLLEHGPCDRGETLFDLANLWLEQRGYGRQVVSQEHQRALSALIWRRPLAENFLRCMVANSPWAAEYVASHSLRPARQPPSLDGTFSFTAEFDLHDVLELQHSAMTDGRPSQQQSPAIYCGGYCWWAVLAANPRHDRFELYASCSPFSLFQEPSRSSLQPAADVTFTFQGTTALREWGQTNDERLAAMHTHWGGSAFWVPNGSPCLLAGKTKETARGAKPPASPPVLPASARPDTARGGPRSGRQTSRLSVSSTAPTASGSAGEAAAGSSSVGAAGASAATVPATSASAPAGASTATATTASGLPFHFNMSIDSPTDSDTSDILSDHEDEGGELQELTMEQMVAEVRRSCPYAWGASLRVRVQLTMRP